MVGVTTPANPGSTPGTGAMCPDPGSLQFLYGKSWVSDFTQAGNNLPVRWEVSVDANNQLTYRVTCRMSLLGWGADLSPQITVPIGSVTGSSFQVLSPGTQRLTNAQGNYCEVTLNASILSYTPRTSATMTFQGQNFVTGACSGGSGSDGGGGTGGTNSCSAGAPGDPGFGSGTWIPSGMTNVRVFDQSDGGSYSQIPGCVNGAFAAATCPATYNGYSLKGGSVAAIRYIATGPIPTTGQNITLFGHTGLGIPVSTTVSLSTKPNDFSNPLCTKTGAGGTTPPLTIGGTGCPVVPGSLYYYNIKPSADCLGGSCTYKIQEPTFLQGTTVSC
ncbi:MAG: hypothetical protein IPJ68_01870 [Candidatus Moraniibacteriota bacterium]|nr:MAG: hypothetical protein IPJ68_01870 [Candidatus Moranbacteria bacterium]